MKNAKELKNRIRVLIVDDSSMVRHLLHGFLTSDPEMEVVGFAVDPYDAREKLVALRPDVMTLDVEMPRMDGITFLQKVMKHFPTRTVIISSLTPAGSGLALRALSVGAIDVIAKPRLDLDPGIKQMAKEIVNRVRAAASARLIAVDSLPPSVNFEKMETAHKVIAIASSTGGTEALKVFLNGMPKNSPGMLIVQHMPPVFTKSYANLLRNCTPFDVREAQEGDRIEPGVVLIAPGNYHMELTSVGAFYTVHLHQEPLLHGVRPAADHLFRSVAKHSGGNAVGVVLTGMGIDGAEGLLAMKQAGAYTLAQDEETSVVFGMPKEAIRLKAVHQVLPLGKISSAIVNFLAPGAKQMMSTA